MQPLPLVLVKVGPLDAGKSTKVLRSPDGGGCLIRARVLIASGDICLERTKAAVKGGRLSLGGKRMAILSFPLDERQETRRKNRRKKGKDGGRAPGKKS